MARVPPPLIRTVTRLVSGGARSAVARTPVGQIATRSLTPNVIQQAASSVAAGTRSTQNNQITGVIRNVNSRRGIAIQNRATSLQKILKVLNTIICGLILIIAVVNLVIHFLNLGHDHIKVSTYGSVSQTTNIGTFRAILKSFDVIRFVRQTGAALTKSQKVDIAMDAYVRGFTETKSGPIPTGKTREQIEDLYDTGELKTKDDIINSGTGTAPKNTRTFDPLNAAAGGYVNISIPEIEYIKELGGVEIEIDPLTPEKTLQESQIATVTSSPASFAAFFGLGAKSSSGNCNTCKPDDSCGNIHVNCHHPLDICLGRAPYNLVGVSGCDKFMCKDYKYEVTCQMSMYPSWVDHLTLQELARFITEHVTKDGTNPLVWPNPAKEFEFLYNDNGYDRRWEFKFDKTWTDGDGTTFNSGDEISDARWKGSTSMTTGGNNGFCCDPYSDQDDITGIIATAKTEVTITDITSPPIDKSGEDDIETDATFAMGQVANGNASQWTIGIKSPVYKPVTQAIFNSWSTDYFEKTRDYKKAKELIDDLVAKNDALRADVAGLNIDYFSPVLENTAFHGKDMYKWYETYRGFYILKEEGVKNAMVQYTEVKKDCECASEILYGSATESIDGEFVVGAEYEMIVTRYKREVCDRPTWTKDADNKCNFVVNCGSDNTAPGDGVVDISYGYHSVGGYINH